MRINHINASGGAGYQKGLLMASGMSIRGERGKRFAVWLEPVGGVGRGIPEHDPRHKAAVNHFRSTGEWRWVDGAGEWTVREDS